MTSAHKGTMRTRPLAALSFLIAAVGLTACTAPSEDDGAEGQESNVTGGSSTVESPVLFLFDASGARDGAPTCAGAMLDEKIAVTAKSCAKEGMLAGRAEDKDGRGTRAKVTRVVVPTEADADIAVIHLDKSLGSARALITHMPLRDNYSVNAFAATDGKGFFSPEKNEASSIKGAILEESGKHGVLLPAKGSEICAGDIGAPVCSTGAMKILGWDIRGTCGLSGLVVGKAATAAPATQPAAQPGTQPATQAEAQPAAQTDPKTCSSEGWKIVQLGRYADFLKQQAPKAFQPLVIDKPVIRNFPYTPDGLWGFKTGGKVAKCTVETTQLAAIKANDTAKLAAKVSFDSLEKNAAPVGRVGIALKDKPTEVRWFAAKPLQAMSGTAFESSYEGLVTAAADGDYLVSFRASANGGETWTDCDKSLALKIGLETAPGETPPAQPGPTAPQSDPPATSNSDYSDPPADTSSSSEEDEAAAEELAPKKKKAESGGCAVSQSGTGAAGSSMLHLAGVMLGLGLVMRRRSGAKK
jgi:hypothetical protein